MTTSFCSLDSGNSSGIFTLTMSTVDGHKYLTQKAIAELKDILTSVRQNSAVKGLVTTSDTEAAGSFCDGIDYDNGQPELMTKGVGEVVKLLLELPMPTVAAVRGDARSLGLALALAHDHLIVWDHAQLSLPEAKLGRRLPGYVAALLRDKVSYARLRKQLMLGSRPCKGSDLPGNPWWSAHSGSDDKKVVLVKARGLLYDVQAEIGKSRAAAGRYAVARQIMFPETCAVVGIFPSKCPRPSRDALKETSSSNYGYECNQRKIA